jgi:hypothetical protein
MLAYPILPFASAADFGFDPYAASNFYREAIYALIYGSTPAASTVSGSFSGGYQIFPSSDDEHFHEGGAINTRDYLGDFARFMGQRNPTTGNARAARAWLGNTGALRRWLFDALGGTGSPADITSLPLDYYAPGAQVLNARTAHDATATQLHLELGTPGGTEHRHLDAGSFMLWRHGRWITRESTGYADNLVGFGGTGVVGTEHPLAHNSLLFQGRSTARWIGSGPQVIPPGVDRGDQPDALPIVTRLQTHPAFSYVAVDYSGAYRNSNGRRVDWPYAERVVREFLFLRGLDAVLVFDRMRASSDSQLPFYFTGSWNEATDPLALHIPAAQVVRTFVMHFEVAPTVSANRVSATLGNQVAELITLLPASPTYRVFNEDRPGDALAGQHRLEMDSTGSVESYFITVLQGRDSGSPALVATLTDGGDRWTVQLNRPGGGSATVVLLKGMFSIGGSVAVDGGAPITLSRRVQGITVTPDGPVWETIEVLYEDGFEPLN